MSESTSATQTQPMNHGRTGHPALMPVLAGVLFLLGCGGAGDSEPESNTPLARPMAFVVNQDDTTLSVLQLDEQSVQVNSTMALGPAEPGAIGGLTFSLGEWIFVTNTHTNKVAAIDPIGATQPILEEFLDVNGPVQLGQRPTRIYRDPVDREVVLTMNEGDPITGLDTIRPCPRGGSVTALHNSHLSAGGQKPHVTTTACLSGTGAHAAAFSLPTANAPDRRELAFVTSKGSGVISPLLADPSYDIVRWSEVEAAVIDLCDSQEEQALGFVPCDASKWTPNHSAPEEIYWSSATERIYCHLSGYGTIVEISPDTLTIVRKVKIAPFLAGQTLFHAVGLTPNGRTLLLLGEDATDLAHVTGRFGEVDVTAPTLSPTLLPFPVLAQLRPGRFQFSPDGTKLFLLARNDVTGLPFGAQVQDLKRDRLLVFDPSTVALVSEVLLPAAASHGMDLWVVGPEGAGSTKGVVVTNATQGSEGSVTLIDGETNQVVQTLNVGRNPEQVVVYYAGLAASGNQAGSAW